MSAGELLVAHANRTFIADRVITVAVSALERAAAGEAIDPRLFEWAAWIVLANRRHIEQPIPW
jgi:hypothetical protein